MKDKNNGAKNINDCPLQTINYNRTCGQSFMFFVQAKAALSDFKVLQKLRAAAAGFSGSLIIRQKK